MRPFLKFSTSTLFLMISIAQGQTDCACSPTQFEWQLDFSLTCAPPLDISVGVNEGISEAECYIEPTSNSNVTDFVPIEVTSVVIFELDKNFDLIKSFRQNDLSLVNGDTYSYVSSTFDDSSVIPHVLQVDVTGINADGQEILNEFILRYTNRCDVLPFQFGDSLGWSIFENLSSPNPRLCPVDSSFSPVPVPSPPSFPSPLQPQSMIYSSSPSTLSLSSLTPSDLQSIAPSSTGSFGYSYTSTKSPRTGKAKRKKGCTDSKRYKSSLKSKGAKKYSKYASKTKGSKRSKLSSVKTLKSEGKSKSKISYSFSKSQLGKIHS